MDLPRPTNWQDFERMVRSAMEQKWRSPGLQLNGRPGQAQNGVDIYGPDEIGRRVGIQCKRCSSPLSFATVEAEVKNAEEYKGPLTTLFIASTVDHDSELQEKVRLMSDKRVAENKFSVAVLFWNDVVDGLVLNPAVFSTHYPQIVLTGPQVQDREKLLAALELGYYGAHLWEFVSLICDEFGWMANEDPDQIAVAVGIVERRAKQLLPPDFVDELLVSLAIVIGAANPPAVKGFSWDAVEMHAKRVGKRLEMAASYMGLSEGNMFDIALRIRTLWHFSEDLPSENARSNLQAAVTAVVSKESSLRVDDAFAEAAKLKSGYRFAAKIYRFLDREIRYG